MSSAAAGIDHDRGAIIRFHPSGMRVVMYYDDPGRYWDERGVQLKGEIAAKAGFAVEKLAKDREYNMRMAEAKRQIDAEFEAYGDKIARAVSEGAGNLSVQHLGSEKYAVFNGAERITPVDLTIDAAKDLLQAMGGDDAGDSKAEPSDAAGKAPAGNGGEAYTGTSRAPAKASAKAVATPLEDDALI